MSRKKKFIETVLSFGLLVSITCSVYAQADSNDAVESRASEQIKKKNYYQAIKEYQAAIETSQDNDAKSRYYYDLAMVYRFLHDRDGEINALRHAADTAPQPSVRYDYLETLGKLFIDAKQLEPAKQALQEVLEKSGQTWQKDSARANLFKIDDAEGKLNGRIELFNQQISKDPNDVNALENLAIIYDQVTKDYAKAIPVYDRLSKLQPDNALVLSKLEFCYEQTGQLEKAMAIVEKLMAKDPKAQEKNVERALQMAIRAKQPQTAIKEAKKYVETQPESPEAYAVLGRVAFHLEQYQLANESFEKAQNLTQDSNQRDNLIIEQIAVVEKLKDKQMMEATLRRLIKTTKSEETRANGFLMLIKFLKEQNRLVELINW